MKYITLGMVLCLVMSLFPVKSEAQTAMRINIEAVVRNSDGEPVAGAIVSGEKDKNTAVTDVSGKFSMQAVTNTVLTVKAAGYETVFVNAESDLADIILSLEKVQVAFRKIEKKDLIGGVAEVDMVDLMKKNHQLYSFNYMDVLVSGFSGGLWGMGNVLVLVDGVPRDDNNVLPTEIEKITFMKSASAVALYGSRAAKGVIYITTKRGEAGEQKFSIRANTGLFTMKEYPKYLGSAEYMTLFNEARGNDDLDPLYSPEDIYNHSTGSNPYRYPDVNYYSSDYIRKTSNRTDITTEISGGNQRARFYTNVGFYYEDDYMNFGKAKDDYINRLNVRGNIDVKLNDFMTAWIDANATYYNAKTARGNFWNAAANTRPNRFTPLIPISMIDADDEPSWTIVNNSNYLIDGKYLLGGTQLDQTNAIADLYAAGTSKFVSRQFQFNAGINFDLESILEGLSFVTQFGVDYATQYNQVYPYKYAVYEPVWVNYDGKDAIGSLKQYGVDEKTGKQHVEGSSYRQTIFFSGQFNYNNTFNEDHNVSGVLVANGWQRTLSGVYHKISNVNLGIQLGYNYKQKYYADFSGAVVHSAKLAKGKRTAFSPTFTLGWRISDEPFLKGSSVLDNLKLSVSAGVLNTDLDIMVNDNEGYYLYDAAYAMLDNNYYYSWNESAQTRASNSVRGANKNLGFVKRKEISANIEASFLQEMISLDASFFYNRLADQITQAYSLYPNYLRSYWPESSFIPYINYNEDQRMGFDFSLMFKKRIGKVDGILGVTGTYYTTKAKRRDEVYGDKYQYRVGKQIDGHWGLINEGFFADNEDIQNSPQQTFGEVKPGDIKYRDINKDGVIDSKDEVFLGRWAAPFRLGLHLTLKWKDFTFFALGGGAFGAYGMKGGSYWWVQGEGKYSEVVRGRWTEETKDVATYPRLTSKSSPNNFRNSDFWLYKSNMFRLAKVQITYDLPDHVLRKSFLSGLSIYVSGDNLHVFSKQRKMIDMNAGGQPSSRFYNLGVKVSF